MPSIFTPAPAEIERKEPGIESVLTGQARAARYRGVLLELRNHLCAGFFDARSILAPRLGKVL